MPRARKRMQRIYAWTDEQYTELTEYRVAFAHRERELNSEFLGMDVVQTAKEKFPKAYYPKELLSKGLADAMLEREADRQDLKGGISVTMSVGSRDSLDVYLLKAALERRSIDPDDIMDIVEESTTSTEFTQVRVNFPRAKKEDAVQPKRTRRTRLRR